MTDLATLGIIIDSSQAPKAASDLDKLTAAGARAEGQAERLGAATKSASVQAAELAAQAQAAARAAVGTTAGVNAATSAIHGNTIAMRESLVIGRELLNGNLTRLPGSLSILAQQFAISGKSASSFAQTILQSFGIIKRVTDAEIASEAAAAVVAADAVRSVAARAQANVIAADTEVALSRAAIKTATTTEALAAAQAQLAAAHEGVTAAAAEATIAEVALADAMKAEAAAAEAAAAATTVALTPIGAILAVIAVAAALAVGGFKAFQSEAQPEIDQFVKGLGLTEKQVKKLQDTSITFGDVMKGVWKTIADHTIADEGLRSFKAFAIHQFKLLLDAAVDVFAELYGDIVGTYRAAVDIWKGFGPALGDAFYQGVNAAIGAINKLIQASANGVNGFIEKVNAILPEKLQLGRIVAPQIAAVANQYAGAARKLISDVSGEIDKAATEARSAARAIIAETERNIIAAAEERIGQQADVAAKKAKKAKEEVDKFAKALAKLNDLLAQQADIDKDILNGGKPVAGGTDHIIDPSEYLGSLDITAGPKEYLSLLQQISAQAQVTAGALASAFGPAGNVFGSMLTNITDYRAQQQALTIDVLQGNKTQAQADAELADLRHKNVSSALAGLKSLFKEHSAGYKVMSAVEKAYAIFQAVQTAAAIARDIAHTASSLANSATRTTANTAEGGSKIFAQLGVWAFPVVAAMVALIASLGFKGGKGGSVSAPASSDAVQAAQGAGTVLGDASAKSDSIAHSLDLTAKNTNKMLEYDNQQLRTLRSIDQNIGALAAQVAKELQVGGAFDLTGKTGSTSSSGFLGLFGSTTTKSLYDQGLQFNSTSLADAIANGISGSTYQIIEKVKKSSGFLGIGGGTKTSYSTTTGALDPDLQRQVGLILGQLRDSVVGAAKVLGFDVQAALDQFQVEIGKISFKDMSADEIEKALENVFSKVADQMAGFAVSGLETFQKAGEGLFETLQRLAKDYTTIDVALKSIGKTFGSVGAASIAAREHLIELFGSLENFVDQTAFFQQNFLTDAQAIAPVQQQVRSTLASLGLSYVDTIAEFTQVVQGIDLTTDAGQQLYASLMALAPAFYQVEQYEQQQADAAAALAKQRAQLQIKLLEAQGNAEAALALQRQQELAALDPSLRALQQQIYAAQDVAAAQDKLAQAYQRERSELEQTISKFGDLSKSLRAYRDTLFGGSSGGLTYNQALANLIKTGSLAAAGDETALGDLSGVGKSFLDVAKDRAGSLQQYQRDVALVARYVDQGITAADSQVSVAQRQLDTMTDQVSKLVDINASVLTVKQAIIDLTKLMSGASTPAPSPSQTGPRQRPGARHDSTGSDLRDVLDGLSRRVDDLTAATVQVAVNTRDTSRTMKRWDRGGSLAVSTDSDTPLNTVAS